MAGRGTSGVAVLCNWPVELYEQASGADTGGWILGRRQAFLKKWQGLLSKTPAERVPKLKEMISQLTFSEQRGVGDHVMRKFDKPAWLRLPRADNTFCVKCKRLAAMYKSLRTFLVMDSCQPLDAKGCLTTSPTNPGRSKTRRKEMQKAAAEVPSQNS